ncbi:hypothetical protein JCM10212_003411 [Sporobolomyces blumeae]
MARPPRPSVVTSTPRPPPDPLLSPHLSPPDERSPLLRRVASLGPDTLRRKSHQISDLLFDHANPVLDDPLGTGFDASASHDASYFRSTATTPRPGFSNHDSARGHGYDGEFRQELEGEGANGVRGWYDNFHTIDWIHDAIKHSLRLRRLRRLKRTAGVRGLAKNLWDGSQGWVLVSVVGFATACIAYAVIGLEMVFYDLKEGYCRPDWTRAKRFCCRESVDARLSNTTVPTGASFVLHGWSGLSTRKVGSDECPDWTTWADVWQTKTGEGYVSGQVVEYASYILLAILFSTTASALTIYFTSSTAVYSSKDSLETRTNSSTASPSDPSCGHSQLSHAAPAHTPNLEQYHKSPLSFPTSQDEVPEPGAELGIPRPRPRKTLYFAAGSGIPEIKTILSGFVIRGYLGSWTLGVKSVGLFLAVASGLSLGKEGPFVHIASCVGNIASRFFPKYDRNEAKRREILSAACAAGVAVAFGAPVGGVLFSLEEVSYFFPPRTMLRSFWCAAIAATTLKLLDPFKSGKIVLFAVSYDKDWRYLELIGFLFLGVFGGLYGAWFCKANIWWTMHVRNGTFLKRHPIVEVGIITCVTVCLSFFNTWSKLGGTEFVYEMFSECHKNDTFGGLCVKTPDQVWPLIKVVGIAGIVKALLTVATFGVRVPAGIFIPTLAVGACFGRICGLVVELVHARYPLATVFEMCHASAEDGGPLPFGQACVLPGVWAMIGAVSTLAGVTRTTVSLAVIAFELTGTLTYSLPTMFAVLVAKTVADWIEPRSIYDLVIEVADLPYLDAKAEYIHAATPFEVVDADAPFISLDDPNTVASLRQLLVELYHDGRAGGFPIVASDHGDPGQQEANELTMPPLRMYAYIASKELEHGLALARARGLADSTPVRFRIAEDLRDGTVRSGRAGGRAAGGGALGLSGMVTPLTAEDCHRGSTSDDGEIDLDLGWLVDSAPIVVNVRSPMELLHEMFSKLGVRYLVVIDERGLYRGVIEKNRYLVYLRWLEKRAHAGTSHGPGGGGKHRALSDLIDDDYTSRPNFAAADDGDDPAHARSTARDALDRDAELGDSFGTTTIRTRSKSSTGARAFGTRSSYGTMRQDGDQGETRARETSER